jgi:hypothetical protein
MVSDDRSSFADVRIQDTREEDSHNIASFPATNRSHGTPIMVSAAGCISKEDAPLVAARYDKITITFLLDLIDVNFVLFQRGLFCLLFCLWRNL